MKRLLVAAGLVLASLGAHAQGTPQEGTAMARQAVDLQNDGVTTVPVKWNKADGKNVRTVATGSRKTTTRTRRYATSPRGGCYYTNASGTKIYVDSKLCK